MKVCSTCKKQKEESFFSKKRDGLQSVCKNCHSEYRKNHYEQNRQKYIDKAKKNRESYIKEFYEWLSDKSCIDCGNEDIRVLEFDHVNGKEFNISKKIGARKLESLFDEISKCEIVCANCHRIRTSTRAGWQKSNFLVQK